MPPSFPESPLTSAVRFRGGYTQENSRTEVKSYANSQCFSIDSCYILSLEQVRWTSVGLSVPFYLFSPNSEQEQAFGLLFGTPASHFELTGFQSQLCF